MSDHMLLERLQFETELLGTRTVEQTKPGALADLTLLCQEIPAHARMSRESLFRRLVNERRADELEEEGYLGPDHPFRLCRIAGAGHTFRPLWAQAQLREAIEGELSEILASDQAP